LVKNIDLHEEEFQVLHCADLRKDVPVNCIHLCDNKIFNFSSSYTMQPDLQEEIIRRAIVNDKPHGTKDRYFMNDFGSKNNKD
jgi:hypothetical protein